MRPRLQRSNADLAWLFALLPLAMFDGLALWWANAGGVCDGAPCDAPLQVDMAVGLSASRSGSRRCGCRARGSSSPRRHSPSRGVVVHFVAVVAF
jgi:hypothetical protein